MKMTEIGPINRNGALSAGSPKVADKAEKKAARKRAKKDRLEISEAARQFQAGAVQEKNMAARATALRNEKIRAIKKRVADGFYDRPEIVDKVAERLIEGNFVTDVESIPKVKSGKDEEIEVPEEEESSQNKKDPEAPANAAGL
ncbi:hypothetical protein TRIP_C30010 [Candidatus Zixiibacteriota bacterium]|nr:hypothetical protein TRIP_C30010 [candidate division Zixibacteria bacterium]